MIDPKTFIKSSIKNKIKYKEIDGSFACSEPGCFETNSKGQYDTENKKVYWTCSNGHECSARLVYE